MPVGVQLRRKDEAVDPSILSELCSHCGSCCDGTLFTHVVLTEDDAARLAEHGTLAVGTFEGGPVLRLGCQHHSELGCGIYSARPDLCRSYRCRTLGEFADGAISFSVALGRVKSLRQVVSELVERHGPPPVGQMLESWIASQLEDEHETKQAKVAFGVLRYLEQAFFARAPDSERSP